MLQTYGNEQQSILSADYTVWERSSGDLCKPISCEAVVITKDEYQLRMQDSDYWQNYMPTQQSFALLRPAYPSYGATFETLGENEGILVKLLMSR